jgi:hypothetical protein
MSFPSAASKGNAGEKLQRPASPQNTMSAQPRRWHAERLRYPILEDDKVIWKQRCGIAAERW